MFEITMDTWIVSDTHFGHANIVRYCDRPENHDEVMLENWNSVVSENDYVLHLGDLAFWRSSDIDYVSQLKGNKYLIKGNHDHKSDAWFKNLGFTVLPRKVFYNWKGRQVLFTHRPEMEFLNWSINIHGHLHNNGYGDEFFALPYREKDYRNVSIEVMGYTPVRLREVLEGSRYQSPQESQLLSVQTSA